MKTQFPGTKWCLSLLALLALPAVAQPDSGWYAGLGLGWNYADTFHTGDDRGRIDYDFGLPAASVALGRNLPGRWRLEFELSQQENEPEVLYFRDSDIEIDSLENDRLAATSTMFNAIRDFHLGTAFHPYLGLGIGAAKVRLRFTDGNDEAAGPLIDDATWALAYQAIAGISIPLSRRLALGIDYRYWRAPDLELRDAAGSGFSSQQAIQSGWVRLHYQFGERNSGYRPVPDHPADKPKGFYLSAALGGGWAIDADLRGTESMLDAFSIGPMASIAAGYQLSPRWRMELEAASRKNDMQVIDNGFIAGERRTTGYTRASSLAVNVIHRFRPRAAINPVIGAGLGVARIRHKIDLAAGSAEPLYRDRATGGVFQWLLGFDMALTNRWTVTTDYRMWISTEMSFESADGERVKALHVVHSMGIGIRYQLGG